jgi:hypothetical protein
MCTLIWLKVGLQAIYSHSSAKEVKQIANLSGHLVLFMVLLEILACFPELETKGFFDCLSSNLNAI